MIYKFDLDGNIRSIRFRLYERDESIVVRIDKLLK